VASGFSGGSGGSVGNILGYYSPSYISVFGGIGGTLGGFIQEAQLDDYLYIPKPAKPSAPRPITTSRELPGSTHWDPAPVPVGKTGGKPSSPVSVVFAEGVEIPILDILGKLPSFENEGQPPIIYSPPPILLPGQTDPGREEQEHEEGEMAHTWTHLGSQIVGALFPNTVAQQSFVAGPGQVAVSGNGQLGPFDPGPGTVAVQGVPTVYSGGSCPPAKTRTLTIDCATGLEVKRKRRRRRALLTQGDMGVLFQIASLPNNANVRVALAGAIRR